MASRSVDQVNTFTVNFTGHEKYNESSHANLISQYFNTHHTEIECGEISPELLFKLGFNISGSDLNLSERTNQLKTLGIMVSKGHASSNINGADVVVFSSAVNKNNPELLAADQKQIPVIRRAEMLAELLKVKPTSIAIAGTHGKTSTCSMLGSILIESKLNPTMVIGGIVNKFQSNTISGSGNVIVVEDPAASGV